MHTLIELVDRFVAVWNEPEPDRRRQMVRGLSAADGAQILQPPQEMLDRAAQIGFINPALEARGHEELEARVTRAHEEFIAPGEFRFRRRGEVTRLREVVKFTWEMVPTSGGEPAGIGLEFLILDDDGRIRTDYQFIER